MGKSREAEHQAFLDWLIDLAKAAASLIAADQESLAELNVEDVFQQRLQQEELTDEQLQKQPC